MRWRISTRSGTRPELLHRGADPETLGSHSNAALIEAVEVDRPDIVVLLMDANAQVDRLGALGRTALMVAASLGRVSIMELLVQRGAGLALVDQDGRNVLMHAARNGHSEALKWMFARGLGPPPDGELALLFRESLAEGLAKAVQGNRIEDVRFLLDQGAPTETPGSGTPALIYAAEKGHVEVMELLLGSGAAVEAFVLDRNALMLASYFGRAEAVNILLQHGADPNIPSPNEHYTALMLAAGAGHVEIMKVLLEHRADVDVRDGRGRNAVMHAESAGQKAAAAFLLKGKAEAPAETRSELTPKLKVMIVEDHIGLCDTLNIILKTWRYPSCVAHSGGEAFRIMEEARPDLVLLDIILPDENGFSLARRVKETEWGRKIRFIALTGDLGAFQNAVGNPANRELFWWAARKPLEIAQLRDILAMAEKALCRPAAGKESSGARVLIIEDDRELVAIIEHLLQDSGFDVRTTFDGEDGLKEAERFRPHIILLDVMMPKVDGITVYGRLTASDWGRQIWFIVMSGAATDRRIVSCHDRKSLGTFRVSKPIDPNQLFMTVKMIANVAKAHHE